MAEDGQGSRRFHGDAAKLRAPERVARLQPELVVSTSLEGAVVRSVLDVGTGTGLFAEAFARTGAAVTGVDISPDLLAKARSHVPEVRFVEASAETLPFEDGAFDLVFMGYVLHESDEPAKALGEAGRVARRRVVVLEWPYRREESGPPIEHRLRPEAIESLAAGVGLEPEHYRSLSHTELYVFRPEPVVLMDAEADTEGS